MWPKFEKNYMTSVTHEARGLTLNEAKRKQFSENIAGCLNFHKYRDSLYFFKYTVCELVSVIVVILYTIYFLWFTEVISFHNGFQFNRSILATLIPNVLSNPYLRNDTMIKIFPRKYGCHLADYGPSGTIQMHNALCQVPYQPYNEGFHVLGVYIGLIMSTLSLCNFIFNMLSLSWFRSNFQKEYGKLLPYSQAILLFLVKMNVDELLLRDITKIIMIKPSTEIINLETTEKKVVRRKSKKNTDVVIDM